MTALDHLEIGTLSFARCDGEMIISPDERVRLILAAIETYEPDLLVTAGHSVHTLVELRRLAAGMKDLGATSHVVTEVLHDQLKASDTQTHAMYAVHLDGHLHGFGRQLFARSSEIDAEPARLARFEDALPQRTAALGEWNVFALICGELNVVRGRDSPDYLSAPVKEAMLAADIVINPTHDRMGRPALLDAKRKLLSKAHDGRERVYVSCSNWEACGNDAGRVQHPSASLHTVYASGNQIQGEEYADGAFGFVYRHWELDL